MCSYRVFRSVPEFVCVVTCAVYLAWICTLCTLHSHEFADSLAKSGVDYFARRKVAEAELQQFSLAIRSFHNEKGRCPDCLCELVQFQRKHQRGALTPKDTLDPWGHKYFYRAQNQDWYLLICLGADGERGGSGLNSDFTSGP